MRCEPSKSRLGVYFVPGNHEYFYGVYKIMEMVEYLGVTVLNNTSLVIDDTINLVGVTDMIEKRFNSLPDLPKAFSKRRRRCRAFYWHISLKSLKSLKQSI